MPIHVPRSLLSSLLQGYCLRGVSCLLCVSLSLGLATGRSRFSAHAQPSLDRATARPAAKRSSSVDHLSQRITPPLPEPELPSNRLPVLPSTHELLPPSPGLDNPEAIEPSDRVTLVVERFEVVGSTVFDDAELVAVVAPFTGRTLTFAELMDARSAVTQLYIEAGYVSSGAVIPPQTLNDGVVEIQVVEGSLEAIEITGTQRLDRSYIHSRLALAASTPLNVNALLESLQLLNLDPLIKNIAAELQAGDRPETRRLWVNVSEAKSFFITPTLDNARVPSVGSFRQQIVVEQGNTTGVGDPLVATYSRTKGSNVFDLSYARPINPRNGTLQVSLGASRSEVIEEPFDILGIESKSNYYEVSYRQPLTLTPREALAWGLTFSWQDSQTQLRLDDIGGFPLSAGADENGSTRIAALRFFQDWTQRSEQHVLALRSQASFGLEGFLNASDNPEPPDSGFFIWRGQGQWGRVLGPDTLLIVRGDIQLSDRPLVPLEQMGLGGVNTVRGYRQEALLTDNAILVSTEVQLPIARMPDIQGQLHLVPFLDFGTGWNRSDVELESDTLFSTGLGVIFQTANGLSARLDWGIPLIETSLSDNDSLQESGIYFSIQNRF